MKMNDNTILRIKVPAHLYEAVKAQLTLKEGKNDYGMPGAKTIKEKKTSDGAKKTSAPKNDKASKNVKASVRVHSGESEGDNASRARKGVPFQGMTEKKAPKKKLGLEELQAIMEILQDQINEMESQQEKQPVEEAFDMAAMAATTDIADMIKSALKAGKKVTVTSKKDKEGKGNDPASDPEPPKPKEIEGIESGRIKVKHTGPRHGITGGSGLPDIDLSDVDSLFINGEEQTLPQPKEPEVQYINQPNKRQWDFTSRWPDIPLG